jgi:hypothetical protein
MYRTTRFLTFIFLISTFFSCAKTDEEAIRSAIREAHYHLTNSDCSDAKDVLDEVGEQKDNADYVAAYASALACTASYQDLNIIDNLTSIDTSDANGLGFITSFAAFATSNETAADQVTYTGILDAIRYILEADTSTPSTSGRLSEYGTTAGNDLSMQALYMITVAFGKFFNHYGDADSTGTKGADGNNDCVYSYTHVDAAQFVNDNSPSGCTASGSEGSADLEAPNSATVIQTRLCEGLYLFNNLRDILGGIELSSSSTLGNLTSVETLLDTVISNLEGLETGYNNDATYANSISAIKGVTSMTACEALDIERLEKFYAIVFETLF